MSNAIDEVKYQKDDGHGGHLVGDSAGTLKDEAEQLVLEELDVLKDDGHAVHNRVYGERQIGSRRHSRSFGSLC